VTEKSISPIALALRDYTDGTSNPDPVGSAFFLFTSKIMPWHIVENYSKCEAAQPFGVIKDSDNSLAGCHATRAAAEAQMRALYASENGRTGKVIVEYKTLPAFTKSIEGRTVTGIFAVHGNVDDGGDMSVPGSFSKYLNAGRKRVRFLWNHNGVNPPIASIRGIREIGREELPDKVLRYAPNATGGVEVTRDYYEGVELADWVLAGIRAGDIDEMSYAYNAKDVDYKPVNEVPVRMLLGVEIFDISDVNWGLNGATTSSKQFSAYFGNLNPLVSGELSFIQHSEAVVSTLEEYAKRAQDKVAFRAKEGRVLSTANRERLSRLMEMMQEVTADISALMDSTTPKPLDEEEPEGEYMGKLATPAQYLALLAVASQNRIAISQLRTLIL